MAAMHRRRPTNRAGQHICSMMDTVPDASGDPRQLCSDMSSACFTPASTSSVPCVSIHKEYCAAVTPERSCGAWTSAGSLQQAAQGSHMALMPKPHAAHARECHMTVASTAGSEGHEFVGCARSAVLVPWWVCRSSVSSGRLLMVFVRTSAHSPPS